MQHEDTDGEDDEAQSHYARYVFHHREPDPPDHDPHPERGHGDPQSGSDVTGQLQGQRDATDLGGHGHEIDEERCAEIGGSRSGSEPFANDLEGRASTYGGDPTGHLREEANTQHTHGNDPYQRQAEARADDGIGHQVADVEETTDGGENPEGDREDLHQR